MHYQYKKREVKIENDNYYDDVCGHEEKTVKMSKLAHGVPWKRFKIEEYDDLEKREVKIKMEDSSVQPHKCKYFFDMDVLYKVEGDKDIIWDTGGENIDNDTDKGEGNFMNVFLIDVE